MKKIIMAGISFFTGIGIGGALIGKKANKIICEKQVTSEKFRIMYKLLERWMTIMQRGESLEKYLKINGYKKIAIYGMGDIGVILYNDLKNSEIDVLYGIDKNKSISSLIQVYSPEEELPQVDAIIVTAIAYFDEIEEMLSEKNDCPILSLEDIIYEIAY